MMFTLISVTMLFTLATAEFPPSNRYLPPPSDASEKGYGQTQHDSDDNTAEGIIAVGDDEAKAFYDSSRLQVASTTFGADGGRDLESARNPLYKHYNNGFSSFGNDQLVNNNLKQEENGYGQISDNVFGKHSLEDANIVSYQADESGIKPQISYGNTDAITRSGYNSNANNLSDNRNNNDDSHNDNTNNGGFGHLNKEDHDGNIPHGNGDYNNAY